MHGKFKKLCVVTYCRRADVVTGQRNVLFHAQSLCPRTQPVEQIFNVGNANTRCKDAGFNFSGPRTIR